MPSEPAIITRTWAVGARSVTFTVPRPKPGHTVHCCCEWSPDELTRLEGQEWLQYRAGRDAAIADVARELGLNAAVLET